MPITVVCLAASECAARGILSTLRDSGIPKDDISVLFAQLATTKGFAHEMHSKAPAGAVTGGSTGGVLGGVLGWLVGIGSIAIPGVGPFIAAGPLLAALSGAAIGAALGGITGTLVGLGIPEIEAKRFEVKVHAGGVLISIAAADNRAAYRIRTLLRKAGAQDIATSPQLTVTPTSKDIEITTAQGVVQVSGTVPSESDRLAIIAKARKVDGVVRVDSLIAVR